MTTTIATGIPMKTLRELNTAHPRQTKQQLKETRNKQIIEMRKCGFTISQIAEYFELSFSGIRYVLQQHPYYRHGVGNDDMRGRKMTCDMSVKVTPELEPIAREVKHIIREIRTTPKYFANRLCGGN